MYTFGNVKYHLSNLNSPAFLQLGFDSINTFGDIKVLRNKYFIPFGYTYDKFIRSENYAKLDEFKKQASLLNAFVLENEKFYDKLTSDFNEITEKDSGLIISAQKFNFEYYKH